MAKHQASSPTFPSGRTKQFMEEADAALEQAIANEAKSVAEVKELRGEATVAAEELKGLHAEADQARKEEEAIKREDYVEYEEKLVLGVGLLMAVAAIFGYRMIIVRLRWQREYHTRLIERLYDASADNMDKPGGV